MSGTILTASEMGKPGASCVVPTLGAVVAVLTGGYSNATSIWVYAYPRFNTRRVSWFSGTLKLEHCQRLLLIGDDYQYYHYY